MGGSQLVSIKLAQRLGRRVVLDAAGPPDHPAQVRRRGRHRQGDVHGKPGHRHRPAAVTAYIDYHPPLPAQRAQLLQRFPQGNAIKCEAIYDKPFWRDEGLAGQVTSDAEPVPRHVRQLAARRLTRGHARLHRGPRSRACGPASPPPSGAPPCSANFATYFGDEALKPKRLLRDGLVERELDPRLLRRLHAARASCSTTARRSAQPVGRIHWAGAETATLWNGYMDGALRSGSRAADEALADL